MCLVILAILIGLISHVCGARTTRPEGDIWWRDFPIALPSTGFISAKSAFDTVMLKVVRKINSPGFCKTIEIINQPSPNSSPFVGKSVFNVIPDKLYNDHYAWTNGVETLSFIPTEGNDRGNWLIGNEPGVDNGYVYLSTNAPSMTPLNLEGSVAEPDYQWKWLLDLKWAPQPAMRAVCKDVYKPGPFYYEIEYFDQLTREAVKSALVPDLNPYILSLHNQLNKSFNLATFLASESNLQIPFPAYYERSSERWRLLEGVALVAEFGSPVQITRAKQATGSQESHIAVLVNEEHSGKLGWRLSFRSFPFTHLQSTPSPDSTKGGKIVSERPITHLEYTSPTIDTSVPPLPDEEEYTVEIDNSGSLDDFRLAPLPPTRRAEVEHTLSHSLASVQPGEYVWIWHAPHITTSKSNTFSVMPAGSSGGAAVTISTGSSAPYDNSWRTDEVTELLLRCKSRTDTTIVFQYFMTDRRDVMKQSQLERDTDFLVMQLHPSSNGIYVPPTVTFRNAQVQLRSMIVLGHDLLNYIRRFLIKKEGATHGLSSCYMYHAAVSMPQALIYAAEILCVLIGSKPVAMIQYTTSSDHQWKFPLVQELTRSIVSAKHTLNSSLDLSYATFTYRTDETLILYRTGREYLVNQLLPHRQAQALHPVPYPEETRLQADWREQIYNSAWNGFVLGYPGFFVESYCESFHNGLSLDEKRKQLASAERNFQRTMAQNRHPTPRIKLGTDEPISAAQYELIRSAL